MPDDRKCVWIFPVSAKRWLWGDLALRVEQETGLRPILVVSSQADAAFYLGQMAGKLSADQIVVAPEIYSIGMQTADAEEAEKILREAKALENRFGMTFMREFVQADRHFGRGFMWGWNQIPESFAGRSASVPGTLRACIKMIRFFDDLAETHAPGLVIAHGGGTGIAGKPVSLLCREKGVPFRSLAASRFGSLYYWAEDEFENASSFVRAMENEAMPDPADLDGVDEVLSPPAAFKAVARGKRKAETLLGACKISAAQLVYRLYWRWTGKAKGLVGYTPVSAALAPFVRWSHARRVRKAPFVTIADLPQDRKIVMVPLQFEPEASLNGQSPEASLILQVIYETALSLPADAVLVVKEHPLQLGRRPVWFYRIVSRMPNTVLLQADEPGSALIKKASLVAQINSSVGYEAAVRGVPVASFGHHGPIKCMQHVRVIAGKQDLDWIRTAIYDAENPDIVLQRCREGLRYLRVTQRVCMDLADINKPGRVDRPTESELSLLVGKLLESLEPNDSSNRLAQVAR